MIFLNKVMNTNKKLRYHPGACLSCYTTYSNLRVCEECETANYCNETCQKEHLQEHKKFCHFAKTIRHAYFTILKITAEHSSTFIYAHIYQFGLALLAEKKLLTNENRLELSMKLQQPGYSFLFYPKVCHVCGEHDLSKLTACESCLSVFYCSDAHFRKDKHSKLCKKYQLINRCLYYEAHNNTDTVLELKYVCCAINYLEPDMTTFIKSHVSEDVLKETTLAVLSLALTEPLSILYAINKIKEILNFTEKEFVFHIIWSNFIGEISQWKKYFIPFLPESPIYRIVFIESRKDVSTYWTESGNFEGIEYIFENVNMNYDKYRDSKYFKKANLKIAFQCDDPVSHPQWENSIAVLLKSPSLLILTSPRRDNLSKKELQRIVPYSHIYNDVEVHLNPFRSIYPHLIPFCEYGVNDGGNYFEYANNYMAVIQWK